jgi:hypothetical protein
MRTNGRTRTTCLIFTLGFIQDNYRFQPFLMKAFGWLVDSTERGTSSHPPLKSVTMNQYETTTRSIR